MQAIAIIGRSYCGSTLLNYLLGSHPDIYGGSEIIRLFQNRPVQCAVCGTACPLWTPDALAGANTVGRARLYDYLRDLTGRPVICDASKNLGHFEGVPDEELRWVVMTKHPLRFLTSFVVNDLYRRTQAPDLATARDAVTDDDLAAFVAENIDNISDFYRTVEKNRQWMSSRGDVADVKYHDLITDPEGTLTRVLRGTGVAYLPTMLDYASHEHHPIGGNLGPHTQARRKAGHDEGDSATIRYRGSFYRSTDGIAMDNKWREALTDRQVEVVASSPGFAALCEQLGYGDREDPRVM